MTTIIRELLVEPGVYGGGGGGVTENWKKI